VRVSFERAAVEHFDLVIGAGGLHSSVRTLCFGPEDQYERYLGYYAASFSSANYRHREECAYVSYAAPGRQGSRYSLRDGRAVFLLVFASDRKLGLAHRNSAAQIDLLRRVFGEDRRECPAMLRALDTCSDFYFDPVSQIRMNAWSNDRVALVGDACSCPSLLAGQGQLWPCSGPTF
jgi:2-polyprenyl-6-methoxyphenol hydroxylase-like FAD-dependent oxidoreductase